MFAVNTFRWSALIRALSDVFMALWIVSYQDNGWRDNNTHGFQSWHKLDQSEWFVNRLGPQLSEEFELL